MEKKQLTKEECLEALEKIVIEPCYKLDECAIQGKCRYAEETVDCSYFKYMILKQLINDHFYLQDNFNSVCQLYDNLLSEHEDLMTKIKQFEAIAKMENEVAKVMAMYSVVDVKFDNNIDDMILSYLAKADDGKHYQQILINKEKVFEIFDKSKAKKPIYEDFDENEIGEMIPNIAKCPTCGCEFAFGKWNEIDSHHCICGQSLDWSKHND